MIEKLLENGYKRLPKKVFQKIFKKIHKKFIEKKTYIISENGK